MYIFTFIFINIFIVYTHKHMYFISQGLYNMYYLLGPVLVI